MRKASHIRDTIKGKFGSRTKSKKKAVKVAKKKAVQGPKTKAMSKPTAKQAGEKLMATFKKLTKVDKRSPSGRKIVDEKAVEETTGGGRGRGARLITFTPVEAIGGNRQGAGKQSRDTKLFSGKFTSRGNRR
tara:strand:- start:7124 stop:7519 length:396 start_codon:yes stop_codon:yes gene_type:complete